MSMKAIRTCIAIWIQVVVTCLCTYGNSGILYYLLFNLTWTVEYNKMGVNIYKIPEYTFQANKTIYVNLKEGTRLIVIVHIV